MGSAAIKPQRQSRLEIKVNGATECSDQLSCKSNIDDENKNTNKVSTQEEGLFRKNDTPGCFGITFRKRVSLSRKSKPSNVLDNGVICDADAYTERTLAESIRSFCDYGYLDHRTGIFFPPVDRTDEHLLLKKHKRVDILPGNLKRSNLIKLAPENDLKLPTLEPSQSLRGSLVSLPPEGLDNNLCCNVSPTRPKSNPYFPKQPFDTQEGVIKTKLNSDCDETVKSSSENISQVSKSDEDKVKKNTTDSFCDSNYFSDPALKNNTNTDDTLRLISPECDNLDLVEPVQFNINPSTRTADSSDDEDCTSGPVISKEHKKESGLKECTADALGKRDEKVSLSEGNSDVHIGKNCLINSTTAKTDAKSSSSDSQHVGSGFGSLLPEPLNPLAPCRPPARLAPLALPDKHLSKVKKLRKPKPSSESLSGTDLSERDANKPNLTTDISTQEDNNRDNRDGQLNEASEVADVKSSKIDVKPCNDVTISHENQDHSQGKSVTEEEISSKENNSNAEQHQDGGKDKGGSGDTGKHIRVMSARVPGNRQLVDDVDHAGEQGEFAHTERRVMSAGCRRRTEDPPEPLRPLTRIEIKKQTFEEGLRPEFRDGGVSFFIPVSEDGLRPHCSAEVVQDRITKTRKSQIRYEEKMMMAQINRQVQLSKRKSFAVKEVQKIKSIRERGSSDSSRAESRAEGADSRTESRTGSRLDFNRSDCQRGVPNEPDLDKDLENLDKDLGK